MPPFRTGSGTFAINLEALHTLLLEFSPRYIETILQAYFVVRDAPLPDIEPRLSEDNYAESRLALLNDLMAVVEILDEFKADKLRSGPEASRYVVTVHPEGYIVARTLEEAEERRIKAKERAHAEQEARWLAEIQPPGGPHLAIVPATPRP